MKHESILALEKTIQDEYPGIAGIVVRKNGELCYEKAFGSYGLGDALHIYSVTKSVFSALVGIAIGKGHIRSVDAPVLHFFPDYTPPEGETAIRAITLRHLLTMTAPYKCDTEPYEAFFASGNWVQAALDLLGGDGPIGAFTYSPIVGSHILSGILQSATGQSILAFAEENLFGPLGIHVAENVALRTREEHMDVMQSRRTHGWVVDPQGINTASWGLFLTPRDMATLGQLYLDGGRDIVPATWVRQSTAVQSRWGELGYGYLWWIIDEDARIYAALGDGGNAIYVSEREGLAVSVAAVFTPDAQDTLPLIMERIAPIFA